MTEQPKMVELFLAQLDCLPRLDRRGWALEARAHGEGTPFAT